MERQHAWIETGQGSRAGIGAQVRAGAEQDTRSRTHTHRLLDGTSSRTRFGCQGEGVTQDSRTAGRHGGTRAGPHPPLVLRPLDKRGLRLLLLRQRLAVFAVNGAPARGALRRRGGSGRLPLLVLLVGAELRSFDIPLRRLLILRHGHGAAEQQAASEAKAAEQRALKRLAPSLSQARFSKGYYFRVRRRYRTYPRIGISPLRVVSRQCPAAELPTLPLLRLSRPEQVDRRSRHHDRVDSGLVRGYLR